MSANSKIEWTGSTWNPVLGCSKKSPGCRGCYAIRQVRRLAGNPNPQIASANEGLTVLRSDGMLSWTGKVRMIDRRLQIPIRTKRPTTYFVNSLSDLFHPALPDDAIAEIFKVMYRCNWHTFQVLTKHGETKGRMVETMRRIIDTFGPLPRHIWLGVSVEDRARLNRIDHLREIPGAVRFLSIEPLLEDLGKIDLGGIWWVIVGGESGHGARPMHPAWVRSIRDQCIEARVPFFFKQWGEFLPPDQDGAVVDGEQILNAGDQPERVGKKAAGRLLDGREWNEMPEVLNA